MPPLYCHVDDNVTAAEIGIDYADNDAFDKFLNNGDCQCVNFSVFF